MNLADDERRSLAAIAKLLPVPASLLSHSAQEIVEDES